MKQHLTIVIGQLNFTVGAIKENADKIIEASLRAKSDLNADLIIFPELSLTGYLPEDLLFRPDLHLRIEQALSDIRNKVNDIDLLLGYPEKTPEGLYNSAIYIRQGEIIASYHKHHLPNYGVFDEKRYFIRGTEPCVIPIKGLPIGILICEDLWQSGPCTKTVNAGAKAIIVINASPYDMYKFKQREELVRRQVQKHNVPIIYAHCVGGQDEVVFDGGSFVMDATGDICQHAGFFNETLFVIDLEYNKTLSFLNHQHEQISTTISHIYGALCLGVKDYVQKNGFKGALLGLSGGIDSALVLAIAVDALGKENVEVVLMPSQFTAEMSMIDAIALAQNMGVKYDIIPIHNTFNAFLTSLQDNFKDCAGDKTEENIQARCRGVILMALSNKFGKLVLTTGNKSEMAVGYATLYGDMAGGFAVLKDVPKTLVYKLVKYRNQLDPIIPDRIIERPPTAELAFNQKDEDSLPPYSVLDKILELYVEQDKSLQDIVDRGFDKNTAIKIIQMVNQNEYKRRQAPPGIRITRRAFGRERRYPITSGFRYDLEE